MKKKFLSVLLSAVLVSSLITACGNKASTSGAEEKDGQSNDQLSFSYTLSGQYLNWMECLNYWPEMQKKSGVSIELINGGETNSAYYQNIDLSVSSQELPDAAIVKQAQCFVYGNQGAFKDLAPLIKEYAPNVQKYIDKNPEYAKRITTSDGKIFGITAENPLYVFLTFYRADHFKKAGITKNPTTIKEFTDVLRKLKAEFGSEQGYYPWVGRESYMHFAEAFNALDYIDEDGKIHGLYNDSKGNGLGYDVFSDGFREMVTWYAQLYKEGLIDPEWVTGTGTEEEWQTKFLTGKGSVSDDFFSRPTWFMNNGGPENDPDYDIQVMDLFKTQDGQSAKRYQPYMRSDRYLVIPQSSKNEVAVLTFLNWLYSDEGREMMYYGIDGVNTEKQADGTRKWLYDFGIEAVKPVGDENFGIYQDRLTFPYPVNNGAYYQSLDDRTNAYCGDYFNKFAEYSYQILYTEEQSMQRSNLLAKYETEFTSAVLEFVNGNIEMNDTNWEKFLDRMNAAGYSEICAIDQAAYDAMA